MNTERLLREIEKRLDGLPQAQLAEIVDAVREEVARDRRRLDPSVTVEAERERRMEAETLREVLEAIGRQTSLDETVAEVLRQLARVVVFDSCSLALAASDGFRVVAVRGLDERVVGSRLRGPVAEALRENRWSLESPDVRETAVEEPFEDLPEVRSWAGIPLVVEEHTEGLLTLHRHQVAPFSDEDLYRARAVAFSAAAAIRRAQLHEQLRRYALLLERVVAVTEAVFAEEGEGAVARAIVEGALVLGGHAGGLLLLAEGPAPRVAAVAGEALEPALGRRVPSRFDVAASARLDGSELSELAAALAVDLGAAAVRLVPIASPDAHVGTLVLTALAGDAPDDPLMEAFAARSATAYLHARHDR